MNLFDFINPFKKPEVATVIQDSISEYRRLLVSAEAAAAYQTKMAEYYREGIERLKRHKY